MSLLKKYLVKKKIIPNLLKQRSCQKKKKTNWDKRSLARWIRKKIKNKKNMK